MFLSLKTGIMITSGKIFCRMALGWIRINPMPSSTAVINDIPLSSPTFFDVPPKAEKVALFYKDLLQETALNFSRFLSPGVDRPLAETCYASYGSTRRSRRTWHVWTFLLSFWADPAHSGNSKANFGELI